MAKRTVIELIDDLDGSEATETVYFGLDGADYAIDLAGKNADELRGLLARFVDAGRKTGASKQATSTKKTGSPSAGSTPPTPAPWTSWPSARTGPGSSSWS